VGCDRMLSLPSSQLAVAARKHGHTDETRSRRTDLADVMYEITVHPPPPPPKGVYYTRLKIINCMGGWGVCRKLKKFKYTWMNAAGGGGGYWTDAEGAVSDTQAKSSSPCSRREGM
jgi:hypothetical protein